jgi:hypothetical protein
MELIEYDATNPSAMQKIQYLANDFYLSGSKQIKVKSKEKNYWVVSFANGITDTKDENERFYTRCVRTLSTKKGEY